MNLNKYKNLNILVTGGAGFIGSHLTEKLVELGSNVTVLDNLSTGNLDNLDKIRFIRNSKLCSYGSTGSPRAGFVNFIKDDITNFEACLSAAKNKDIVFHLAAFISVQESLINPNKCNNVNIQGTLNLLEACRTNKVDKFVFSSSSAVYGNKNEICSESDECNPESPYGYSKLIGEMLCKQYAEVFNLKTICLRYFNVYGDRQNPNGLYAAVVAKFKDAMKTNNPITIYGDGEQKRDFIEVQKVVEANIKCALLEDEKLNGQSINVATGSSITLLELIINLKKEFPNYRLEPIFQATRKGDILISKANCQKYYNLF